MLKLKKRHSLFKEEKALVDSIIKGMLCQGQVIEKDMNPLDRNGQISKCVVCDSKMHWPHSKNIKQQSTNVIELGV